MFNFHTSYFSRLRLVVVFFKRNLCPVINNIHINIDIEETAVADVVESEPDLAKSSMDFHVEEEERPLTAEDNYFFPPRKLFLLLL